MRRAHCRRASSPTSTPHSPISAEAGHRRLEHGRGRVLHGWHASTLAVAAMRERRRGGHVLRRRRHAPGRFGVPAARRARRHSCSAPWLGLFGDLDQGIPVDDVEQLRARGRDRRGRRPRSCATPTPATASTATSASSYHAASAPRRVEPHARLVRPAPALAVRRLADPNSVAEDRQICRLTLPRTLSGQGLVEAERRLRRCNPEAAAAGLLDPDRRAALVEAALEQDEPALEVVAELGQLERRVEPDLLVGELDASFRRRSGRAATRGCGRPRP